MHMADALVSPAVGATMWVTSAALIGVSAREVRRHLDERQVPLMGVLGAFVFAGQMINFTIPGTGSSGHLGGGLLLAILLGPCPGFLAIASVLMVQALFFADGGLLALGCNMFNLGFFPCFVAYPLIYRPLLGSRPSRLRRTVSTTVAAVVGLQLGSLAVVLETLFSGLSALPFTRFVLLMQPIHLGIGLVEGLATAAVIGFVSRARPEVMGSTEDGSALKAAGWRPVVTALLVATVLIGGVLSWFASTRPDGLEWSLAGASGREEVRGRSDPVHGILAEVQGKTAVFPDYALADASGAGSEGERPSWPAVDAGTSVAGLVGGLMTLVLVLALGWLLRARVRRRAA